MQDIWSHFMILVYIVTDSNIEDILNTIYHDVIYIYIYIAILSDMYTIMIHYILSSTRCIIKSHGERSRHVVKYLF